MYFASNRIRWKTQKGLLRRSRSFKVIEVRTNRKPECDFLLVINSNWQPISDRCGVIAAYCSNFGHCIFEPPFGGLGTMYDVHLGLIGKHALDFLLVITELFARCYGWGATGKNISKIGDFAPRPSVWPKISCRMGRPPSIIFAWIVRPMNALQLCCWHFSHKETLWQTFLERSVIIEEKRPFLSPLWGT